MVGGGGENRSGVRQNKYSNKFRGPHRPCNTTGLLLRGTATCLHTQVHILSSKLFSTNETVGQLYYWAQVWMDFWERDGRGVGWSYSTSLIGDGANWR
jgi:hypothetical protein